MADQVTTEGLRDTLAGEFRAAVEAVVDSVLVVQGAPAATGHGWSTEVTASGLLEGRLTVWIDDAGVQAIATAMMGLEEAPEPSVASDMLKELFAQAAAATSLKDGWEGLTLVSGIPVPGEIPPGGAGLALRDGDKVLAVLTVIGALQKPAPARSQTAGAAASPASASASTSASEYPGNLAALLDIDLPLVVRFARTEMTLRALSQLGPGSMVDMGRSPDAPVQLLIGTQVIAEGEVVVVSGNYGVRITSLVSPADRLRAMEL